MEKNLYNLLLRSFDTSLTENEHRRLESALASSEELRTAKNELAALRLGLHNVRGVSFKPFFAERVMSRLNSMEQSLIEYYVSAFRRVAIGAAILVVVCSAYNISRENSVTVDSALGIHRQTIEQVLTLEVPLE